MPSKFPTTNESPKHRELKKRAAAYLRAQGFNPRAIRYEYRLISDIRVPQRKTTSFQAPAWFGSTLYVDVVAFDKGRRVAAVEVGECTREKLVVLTKYFVVDPKDWTSFGPPLESRAASASCSYQLASNSAGVK